LRSESSLENHGEVAGTGLPEGAGGVKPTGPDGAAIPAFGGAGAGPVKNLINICGETTPSGTAGGLESASGSLASYSTAGALVAEAAGGVGRTALAGGTLLVSAGGEGIGGDGNSIGANRNGCAGGGGGGSAKTGGGGAMRKRNGIGPSSGK
jgi:hypothetical protein